MGLQGTGSHTAKGTAEWGGFYRAGENYMPAVHRRVNFPLIRPCPTNVRQLPTNPPSSHEPVSKTAGPEVHGVTEAMFVERDSIHRKCRELQTLNPKLTRDRWTDGMDRQTPLRG